MNDIATSAELLSLLKSRQPESAESLDTSTVKYALYARKSTTDEERQEHSIKDQIKDCMDRVVIPEMLQLSQEPIEESCSAKEPDVRPLFRKLIEDIKSSRITGLIAWHPDRLARNMKEAGEIIDLLDKGTLKDLKFATSTFENNPTGKMLLGISFVLSKQYSEHLSESVARGNKRTTEEGQFIGKMKHGYYINQDRHLIPEDGSFLLIRKAFQMRIDGSSQKDIAEWLNSTTYQVRKYKKDLERITWDKDMVSKMLKDPVYAGVLKYGQNLVNLSTIYEFTPVLTVQEFFKINKISTLDSDILVSSMTVKGGNVRANLLRKVVYCGYCNKAFSSALVGKKLKRGPVSYYTYRCDNEDCSFYKQSIRANIVIDCAKEFFNYYQFSTIENYNHYVLDANTKIKERNRIVNSEIASIVSQLGTKRAEYERRKTFVLNNPKLSRHYNLDESESEVVGLEARLDKLKKQRNDSKNAIFTYEKYLKLFENISVILDEMHDMKVMDKVLREFFSNFTIKSEGKGKQQRCDIEYKLKEPWQGFLDDGKFVRGRGERTQTFDLSVPNRARYQLRHTPMVLPDEL